MQHEFNNRIAAQREILRVVNVIHWSSEPLLGLSNKAIARWASTNRLDPSSRLVQLVKKISAKLFFLANKSQEQVTEEYSTVRSGIIALCDEIKEELNSFIT